MADFKREHRYWAVKRKHLTPDQDERVRQFLSQLRDEGVPDVECVAVESDWPIYEETWENVQRLAEGKPSIRDERDEYRRLSDQYSDLWRRERDRADALTLKMSGVCLAAHKLVAAKDEGEADAAVTEIEKASLAFSEDLLTRCIADERADAMGWALAQSCLEENEGVMWRAKIVGPEIERLRRIAQGGEP
ncbi:hypothetical protein GCM10027040_27190 [Halomonas shantousis]